MVIPSPLEQWSPWVPLVGVGRDKATSAKPGLYQVRRVGSGGIDYVGQTGGRLRARLGMLSGAYRDEMPYGDPHTAAPALWALRHASNCEFEASVTEVSGSTPDRKAMEALAISLYRAERGQSPTANFGRMPDGYRKSSPNNARLVNAGGRFRGGLDPSVTASPQSEPVHGDLRSDPLTPDWLGWEWSPWVSAGEVNLPRDQIGLYRLRNQSAQCEGLAYVGQGLIAPRVGAHLARASVVSHRQAAYFSGGLQASWVGIPDAKSAHLMEHENDLISSHVLMTGRAPAAQFLG